MSVVALRIEENMITMATDSQLSCNEDKRPMIDFKKMFRVNGCVMATVGNCDEAIALKSFAKVNKPPKSKTKLQLYMSQFYEWRDTISKTLTPDEGKTPSNLRVLIINDGIVYCIDGLFVETVKDFIAIGSGEDVALGAMEYGADVKTAVKITCKYNRTCGLPVQYMEIKRR